MPHGVRLVVVVGLVALVAAGCGSGKSSERAAGGEVQLPHATKARQVPTTATGPAGDGSAPAVERPRTVPRPRIVSRPIPFGARRRREMAAYAERHYGIATYRLSDPRAVVIHFTGTHSFAETYNMFAPDEPDPELHELPGICSHFVVERDGTIYQVVPVAYMCRHTVGLNYTAVGIEHVGTTDAQILGDRAQLQASLRLTRWLRCRFGIPVKDVIGHNESLSSPYHRENVASLRHQTHPDWTRPDMDVYRRKLAALGGC